MSDTDKAPGLPATMKSWTVTQNGPPSTALHLDAAHPTPSSPPQGSDIIVRVSRAALNPADLQFMAKIPSFLPFRRSPTPGLDFCGTVVAVGPNLLHQDDAVAVGTVVCGAVPAGRVATGTGSLAEYMTVPADCVAARPERLGDGAVAGLGIAGQTAALILEQARVEPGHRMLLNGASGGVGTIVCQVAKARGAVVYGICSGANEEMVRKLGASEVIDYKAHNPVEDHLATKFADAPFDTIVDCVGIQSLYDKCAPFLKPTGLFVNIVGGATEGIVPWVKGKLIPTILGGTPRRYQILALMPNGKLQREVVGWVNDGLLSEVVIDSEFDMEDAVEAYEKVASKRARGKVVVKVAR